MRNTKQKREHLLSLVEGAIMVALAIALDLIPWPFKLPYGGSFSIAAIPIIYYSFRRGGAWGMGAGLIFSLVQMILGFYMPPAKTLLALVGCVMLDYVLAFSVYGAAGSIAEPMSHGGTGRRLAGYGIASAIVNIARFVCSFLSGILLWSDYAPEGTPVWLYSLTYNGGYMLPNAIVTTICVVLLCAVADPRTLRPMKRAK